MNILKNLSIMSLLCMVVGCAGNVTVRMSQPDQIEQINLLAEVDLNDLRRPGIAASKREAAFGVPMGTVEFDPSEAQILKQMLDVELTKLERDRGVTSKQTYICDLVEFGVNTNTTALYWDVIGRIQLVLKRGEREYSLFGTHTERTYVWPGEGIIKKVIEESLRQVAGDLKPVTADM